MFLSWVGYSQSCPDYDKFMKEANRYASAKTPDYKKALANYTVARLSAEDCGISDKANKEIDAKIEALFIAIDRKRREAEDAKIIIENEKKRSDSLLVIAMAATTEATKARDEAITAEKKAQEEKIRAEEALRRQELAYSEATKSAKIAKEAQDKKTRDLELNLSKQFVKEAKEFLGKTFKHAKHIRISLLSKAHKLSVDYYESSRRLIADLAPELGSDFSSDVVFIQDRGLNDAVFSPNGEYVVVGGNNMSARVKKLYDTLPVFSFVRSHPIISLSFSSDNQNVAILSNNNEVQIFNVVTKVPKIITIDAPTKRIEFSPDGQYLLATCSDKTAQVYDLSGQRKFIIQHNKMINYAVFSPDGRYIVTSSMDKNIRVTDMTGRALFSNKHKGNVLYACASPDGQSFLSASADKTARLWDVNGKTIATINHTNIVQDVAFSADGRYLATASVDQTIQLCDAMGKNILTISCPAAVSYIDFSPDGKYLVAALANSSAHVYSLDGKFVGAVQHERNIKLARFCPDSRLLITLSDDGTARLSNVKSFVEFVDSTTTDYIFDVNSTKCLSNGLCLHRPTTKQGTKIFTPTGHASYKNQTLTIVNNKIKSIPAIEYASDIKDISLSPDKKDIMVVTSNVVQILGQEGEPLGIHAGSNIIGAAYSADGKKIIIQDDKYFKVYPIEAIYISSVAKVLGDIRFWDVSDISEQDKVNLGLKEE